MAHNNKEPFHRPARFVCMLFLALAVQTVGCKEDPQSAPPPEKTDSQPEAKQDSFEIPAFTIDELGAKLGGYLPPLDEDRIKVAPPAGWKVEPRDKAYVTRFSYSRKSGLPLPRITIEADDILLEGLTDVNADNQMEFVGLVAGSLDQGMKDALVEKVDPIILEDVYCARYVVNKWFQTERKFMGHREVIKTVRYGRIYTVVLDVYKTQLPDYRIDVYAVVAGMEFLAPKEAEDDPTSDDSDHEPDNSEDGETR